MTLIHGMEFEYEGSFHDVLKVINIHQMLTKSKWVVDCLWVEGVTGESYQEMNGYTYCGDKLLNDFSHLGSDFVYFARIRSYPILSDIDSISSFEDFSRSPCTMIVLVSDGCFYETYTKNEEELLSIKGNLASFLSIDAEIIPMNEFTRIELTV